jgi:cytochrome o ubiquinol oxidase subunit III
MSKTVTHHANTHDVDTKTTLGFWVYLMTDCVLFASLFAGYAVMHGNIYDGPSASEIFDLPFVLVETLILLTSSFTCGLALLAARKQNRRMTLSFFGITFALGLAFIGMELYEFRHLIHEGYGYQRSGFLSAFFTLVGTHGLHIAVGLLWMAVMMIQTIKRGFTTGVLRRLTLLSMFWHFLDVIWIFIFTIVYLFGALSV